MKLSAEQETAIARVQAWLNHSNNQVYRLFGYAGVGKTTIARYLSQDVSGVLFAAFTGKAAYVLRDKGCHGAQTIHSLIYLPRDKSTKRLLELTIKLQEEPDNVELQSKIRAEKENLKRPLFTLNLDSDLGYSKLLIIDECSMVNEKMAEDLLSFGTKILVLGDPAQLPPIYGAGYFTSARPNFLLTEVHRQARDNPILDLATRVRLTGKMPSQHPCIVPKATMELVLRCDQLIVGRNATRRRSNQLIREKLGFDDPLPMVKDKVVCLRNNHELEILNGATYEVTAVGNDIEYCLELDNSIDLYVHTEPFLGGEVDWWRAKDAEMFDYGYALTCHKAQGSQWDKVGLINESSAFRKDARCWLYTAITRASKELWVA